MNRRSFLKRAGLLSGLLILKPTKALQSLESLPKTKHPVSNINEKFVGQFPPLVCEAILFSLGLCFPVTM